jgi:hypothetical protein
VHTTVTTGVIFPTGIVARRQACSLRHQHRDEQTQCCLPFPGSPRCSSLATNNTPACRHHAGECTRVPAHSTRPLVHTRPHMFKHHHAPHVHRRRPVEVAVAVAMPTSRRLGRASPLLPRSLLLHAASALHRYARTPLEPVRWIKDSMG